MSTKLFTTAFAVFEAQSGTRYTANASGQISVTDANDVLDLLRGGCSLQPTFADQLELMLGRNSDGTALDTTGGAGKFSAELTVGTSLTLQSESANNNTKTDQVVFEYVLPGNYIAGSNLTVTANVALGGAGTPGTKTLDLKAYEVSTVGAAATDIGPAAQAIVAAGSDLSFVVTGADLSPNDRVLLVFELVLQETASSALYALIRSIRIG